MTAIEWTDETWNPMRGCWPVSSGCARCYATRQAIRQAGPGGKYEQLVRSTEGGPKWTGIGRFDPGMLNKPLDWRAPRRVFVDSMSDLFFEWFTFEQIAAVHGAIAQTPRHTYQVLTKRIERARAFHKWLEGGPHDPPPDFIVTTHAVNHGWDGDQIVRPWPLPNLWLGVSVEDNAHVGRLEQLRHCPAAVQFVSLEPLLEAPGREMLDAIETLDWVIVGGESGPGARGFHVAWASDIVARCARAGVPCFVKQLGSRASETAGALTGHPYVAPMRLLSRKGGDPTEWPEHLRVRQWPHPKETRTP